MKHAIRLLLSLCLLCAAAAAGAAEESGGFDAKMLEALRERGSISEAQYRELREQMRKEQARARAALPAVAAPGEDPEGWSTSWKDGFRVERNDGLFELKFGGRVHLDAAYIVPDDGLNEWAMMPIAAGGLDEDLRGFGAELRRARLFVEGSFYEHGIFKAEYDFAGQDADFNDVFIGLQGLPGVGRMRVGHAKEGFGLDQMTSSKYITLMERPLPVDAFAPGRNTGVSFDDTALDGRIYWNVGGFAETGDSGNRARSNLSNYNVTARVTGLPLFADGGRKLVHVGVAYTHKFLNDAISYGAREVHLSEDLVDTGEIMADGVGQIGLEFASVLGPFSLQAEWISAWVDQIGGSDLAFWGAYAQASWFVTGEHRAYKQDSGFFDRVKLAKRFSLKHGTWGALELAGRYSYLDLSDENVRGGTQNDVSVGANWYLYSNLRLMLNWVHSHRDGIGDQDAVQGRFMVDF